MRAQHLSNRIGDTAHRLLEVAYLKITEKPQGQQLHSADGKHSGKDQQWTMLSPDGLMPNEFGNHQPGGDAETSHHAKRSNSAKEVQRAIHVFQQEANGHQIEEHAESSRDSIMGAASGANHVFNGNLANRSTIPRCQRRNKTMQVAIQRQLLDDLPPVSLECSAEIMDVHA